MFKLFNKTNNNKVKTSYSQKVKNEIAHYEQIFGKELCQPTPPVWSEVEKHFSKLIRSKTGHDNLFSYVENYVKKKDLKSVKILGLGSGACGPELNGICPRLKNIKIELTCIDINGKILEQASVEAKKRGVSFIANEQDVNRISLPSNTYDIIVAYASLHHFLKLDHITKEINKSLKPNGIFVTVDIPTENGYLMYPETYSIVNQIFMSLPTKFKIDHTKCAKPTYADFYENIDYSINSFECINSKNILPMLKKNLKEIVYVPALSISRRFFDTKFGPNFDLTQPLDKSFFDFIINLDDYYLEQNILKPESFFGVYKKR